jgi:uncharacterized glyoxalase superfamily protein PhnB
MAGPKKTIATVIPGLHYHDAPAAIEWLCRAFGFEQHLVVPGDPGVIDHAQLSFGAGMIMLSSAGRHDGPYDDRVVTPRDLAGKSTQGAYVIVDDPDAHYRRAIAAGAQVVIDLEDKPYGGRGYTCADPEGHVWSFGDYDPWAPGEE